MNRRRHSVLGALALLALSRLAAAAPADFSAYTPKDAYGFVGIGNVTGLRAAAKALPEGKMWEDPEILAFTKPGREKMQQTLAGLGDPWPKDIEGILKLMPGQVAIWAESLEPYKPKEWGAVLMVERKEPVESYTALIDAFLTKTLKQPAEKSKIEAGGETIYAVKWDAADTMTPEMKAQLKASGLPEGAGTKHSFLYSFPEGLFLAAFDGDESIQRAIARSKESEGALAAHPGFRSLGESFAGPQTRAFINIVGLLGIVKEIQEMAQRQFALATGENASLPAGDSGPDYEKLGLTGLYDYSFLAEARDGASLSRSKLRMATEPKGVAKAVGSFVKLDPAALRAAPADPVGVAAYGFDVPAAIGEILQLVKNSEAGAQGMLQASAAIQQFTGMSLEQQIVPAFGTQICAFSEITETYPNTPITTLLVGLANAETMTKLLEALMVNPQLASSLQKSEFLGATIYSMAANPMFGMAAPGAPPMQPSLAIASGNLIFSLQGGDTVRSTIARLSGKDAKNLFDSGKFQLPASESGAGAVGYGRTDYSRQAETIVTSLQSIPMLTMMSGRPEMGMKLNQWLDFSAMPKAETLRKYLGVIEKASYRESDGLSSVSKQLPPAGR